MIRKGGSKKQGPELSVPAGKKGQAPQTGRSSFATRVKTRRRKAQAAGHGAAAAGRPAGTPQQPPAPRPKKQPRLLTRQERLAAARGTNASASSPGIVASGPVPRPEPTSRPAATARGRPATPATPARQSAPKPQREPDAGFVAVGRVQGPFGLKGELKVLSLTDNPDRFRPNAGIWAGQQPVTVAAAREAQGYVYLTLKGFRDRTAVEKFRHALLQVPETDLPELEEGEYYRFQLVGLTAVDRTGSELGVVAEVIETGATDVYRVRTPDGKDLLLPATADVVLSVDLATKRMVVDPPPWT